LQDQRSGVLRTRPVDQLEAPVRRMAEAARKAMPPSRLDDDLQGSQKQTWLRQIALGLLGGKALLPGGVWQHDALWQKIAWYFRHRQWPTAPLRRMRPKSRSLGPGWILLCTIVTVAAVVGAIGALSWMGRSPFERAEGTATSNVHRPSSPRATGEADSSRERTPGAPGAADTRAPPDTTGHAPKRSATAAQATTERDAAEPPREPPQVAESGRDRRESPAPAPAPLPTDRPPAEPSASDGSTPAQPSAQAAPTGGAPPAAESWATLAERFAREHGGKLFDEAPLVNGTLEIAADALPAAADGASPFLGSGVLHFDHATYPFGAGFDARAPVSRHEVPQLAAALSLTSVYVELQSRPEGWAVVLGCVPQTLPPDAEARKKEVIEQIERSSRMIASQLRTYNSRTATEEAKDEAFDKLVELTKIEIPRVPPKPIRGSREYRDDPEAYQIVLDAYNEAVVAHNLARDRVIPAAKTAVATVEERKQYAEEQFRQYEERLRENHEKGLAAIREQCRRISVIVYRAVAGEDAGRSLADADAAGAPAPGEATPAGAQATPPGGAVESMEGRFAIEEKPAQGLAPPAIARIRPIVTGEGGRPLPAWYRGAITTSCELVALDAGGLILRTIPVRDLFAEGSVDVFEKTTAARVTFQFRARGDAASGQPPRAPIATAFCRIERIDKGKQYTVMLQLPKGALDWLRLLAAVPGSSPP